MKIGVNRLIEDMRAIGHAATGPFASNGWEWLIIENYVIMVGRFAGQVVRLAIPVSADYPATPPGGLYISPCIVPTTEMGGLNIHNRANETAGLAGEWQYWSRPIPPGTWRPDNGARRLIAHWNTVMANVK